MDLRFGSLFEPHFDAFGIHFELPRRSILAHFSSKFWYHFSISFFLVFVSVSGGSGPPKVCISLRTSLENHYNCVSSKKEWFDPILGLYFGVIFEIEPVSVLSHFCRLFRSHLS